MERIIQKLNTFSLEREVAVECPLVMCAFLNVFYLLALYTLVHQQYLGAYSTHLSKKVSLHLIIFGESRYSKNVIITLKKLGLIILYRLPPPAPVEDTIQPSLEAHICLLLLVFVPFCLELKMFYYENFKHI